MDTLRPIPFTKIIEADHKHISSLALQFRHPALPPQRLKSTLAELTWRLIRHDISEELVMRPAFARFLGSEGQQMAQHDREDHAAFKARVLDLVDLAEQRGLEDGTVKALLQSVLRDMQRHMDEESGGQLVRFEGVVGEEDSLRLGGEYVLTLGLGPEVEVCRLDGCGGGDAVERERCFPAGVQDYVNADVQRFKGIMTKLVEDARVGRDGGYLVERIKAELGVLRVENSMFNTKL